MAESPGFAIDGEEFSRLAIDGEAIDGDAIDGEEFGTVTMLGLAVCTAVIEGDAMEGDAMDGEAIDGEAIEGDAIDGDEIDGDEIDGEDWQSIAPGGHCKSDPALVGSYTSPLARVISPPYGLPKSGSLGSKVI